MQENEEVHFLDGHRFDPEANKVYKVPMSQLPKRQMLNQQTEEITEVVDFEDKETLKVIVEFIQHHTEKQVPRLKQLKRYYDSDNNIKYRPKKSPHRSDNRIASDFAKFIVAFKRGVLLGNPIKYNGDESLTAKINEFNSKNNEDYHNQLMADDMFTYGRAYELIYRDEQADETLSKLNVLETFIIYDAAINGNSIVGVRYYPVEYLGKITVHVDLYANDGYTYFYECEEGKYEELVLADKQENFFDTVQINEWKSNEDLTGDFESVMDRIDAYDLSQSEMANFQQDSSEAYLVIKGNPATGEDKTGDNSSTAVLDAMLEARMLVLGDKKIYNDSQMGSDPDAYYLKKEYDTAGIEAYNDRLVADMLRFTSLIDFTDENIGSNQSGIGFRFKGWGSDNDRKNKERMIKKAIMRRLRLLTHSWSIKDNLNEPQGLVDSIKAFFVADEKKQEQLYQRVNEVEILFTPNVPQSDEEIMNVIKGMDTIVSEKTVFEMASRLTGVSVEEEEKRVKEENEVQPRINVTPDSVKDGEDDDGIE